MFGARTRRKNDRCFLAPNIPPFSAVMKVAARKTQRTAFALNFVAALWVIRDMAGKWEGWKGGPFTLFGP